MRLDPVIDLPLRIMLVKQLEFAHKVQRADGVAASSIAFNAIY